MVESLCDICRTRMGDGKTYKLVPIERDKRHRAYVAAETLAILLNSGADLDDVLNQWTEVNKSLSDLIGGG